MRVLVVAFVFTITVQIPCTKSVKVPKGFRTKIANVEKPGYYDNLFKDEKFDNVRNKEKGHIEVELKQGDLADLLPQRHRYVPAKYPDFARRFVLQYPYQEKDETQVNDEAEQMLNKAVKAAIKQISDDERLRPVQASPSVVLAVAKQSALLERSKAHKKTEKDLHKEDLLRTGEYWNSFWKEEVSDPALSHLRSGKRIESMKVKIMPGSKLYKLVKMTKDLSPRYLYIINKFDEKDDE